MSWLIDILTKYSDLEIKLIVLTVIIGVILVFFILVWAAGKLRRRPDKPEETQEGRAWRRLKPDQTVEKTPKNNKKTVKILLETLIISQEKNLHKKARVNDLNLSQKIGQHTYKITERSCYKKNLDFIQRLLYRLRGLQDHYLAIFWEGETEPIYMPANKVNPETLATVRTSRALSKALREMFKGSIMENKGLIFIFIVFLAIALFIARAQGYL